MNYLAHFLLASSSEGLLVGGWLGDFVKGRVDGHFEPEVRRGILHHRKIDAYTDTHPINLAGRRRFTTEFRRFAGIITDITYDHFLARHWPDYCHISLPRFVANTYRTLSDHVHVFEGRSREVVMRMTEQDWLSAYVHREAVGGALAGVSRRLRRTNPLGAAMPEVDRLYDDLQHDFHKFFPELLTYSNRVVESFHEEVV